MASGECTARHTFSQLMFVFVARRFHAQIVIAAEVDLDASDEAGVAVVRVADVTRR